MDTGPSRDRGSRKHVLDWLERGDFHRLARGLFEGTNVRLADTPHQQPRDRASAEGYRELDLETYLRRHPIEFDAGTFPQDWWVDGRGTRPTWDLLCHVLVSEKPGVLLVEAKAHESELDWEGKQLQSTAKLASKKNHSKIASCIEEAQAAFQNRFDGLFQLSIDSHYQLANRLAYAWKLADLGVPTVLLYLGFNGDKYFTHDYIRDDRHWQRVMGGYIQGVVPHHFPERVHELGKGGSIQMLVRSLPVFEESTR